MAKRNAVRKDGHTSKPKQLRKRLRKAEARLVKAGAKRDKAQARVEALAIITDEIRAQLAEAERATADVEAAPSASKGPRTSTRSAATKASGKPSGAKARTTKARKAAAAAGSAHSTRKAPVSSPAKTSTVARTVAKGSSGKKTPGA